ncbi:hypothetical protein Tco_0168283 [Tanacetum coccineum]
MHLPSTIKGILQSYTNRDFVFIVLYDEAGRGTIVATGRVKQAMIKVGEEIKIMGLMQVSFFSDEEETTSRPKADALFIPRENLSTLVIHPLETWPGNASAEKPKGVSSPTQTNVTVYESYLKSFKKWLQGTTEFDDVNGIRMATMKEVPPTAYEVDAMKKHDGKWCVVHNHQEAGTLSSIIDPRLGNSFTAEDINRFVLDTCRHLKEKKSYLGITTGLARQVIKEPEAGIFLYNRNFDLFFQRKSKFNLATTPPLIMIQNSIKIDSMIAQEMFDEMIWVIESRPDVVEARKIVEKNLDGLAMN